MDKTLKEQIISANIELHKKEAALYDVLHPDHYCRSERKLIRHAIETAIHNKKVLHALDMGAGTGNITMELIRNDSIASVDAVDISAEMITELKKKADNSGQGKKVNPVMSDADTFFSGTDRQYDIITMSSVLHHLPSSETAIQQIIAHLKPGGICIIFLEPTGEKSKLLDIITLIDIWIFARFFLPVQARNAAKSLDYTLSDYHQHHGFSLERVEQLLRENKQVSVIFRERYNLFKLPLSRMIGRLSGKKNTFIIMFRKKDPSP